MIAVQRLYELGLEIKAKQIGINEFKMVQEESEIVQYLRELKKEHNHLLIIVLPSTDSSGSKDVDSIHLKDMHQFIVLEKRDPKSPKSNFDDMMIYARTQTTMNNMLEYILGEINDETDSSCNILSRLDAASFDIEPVKGPSDCFGYSWAFKMK